MLTLQPAPRPQQHPHPRLGLALAGGGPLGAFYEIGALQALAEAIEGLDLTRLDAYVGVSSGAMIAAGLANGIGTADMGVVFIDNAAAEYPMSPGLFLQPAFREYLNRARGAPGLLTAIVREYLNAPSPGAWAAAVGPLGRLVPTGLFDNRHFERFIAHIFSTHGRSNDFRTLKRRLYVIATDLDGGTEARFGAPGHDHVPISKAIQASTALPGLYPSVEIDGRTYVDGALLRTMHASVALEEGASLVFCVNPLVAFDAYAHGRRSHDLKRGGLPLVMSQTFRALIQSRMQVGMSAYRGRFPTSDMLLLEPDRSDEQLFFVNVFQYAGRRRLAEHAYQRTRADLARQARALGPLLARHGLRLRREVLGDPSRTFRAAMAARRPDFGPVSSRLGAALDRLEAAL
ncbi:MAG TPA: patatin-like phospholipase family protein [Steroidobacteraceae bacterium]|nr:patatin-like phospholipase family protein [Steroidobacteraceae bacterium]